MLSLVAICPYANLLPISIIVCKLVHCVLIMKSQFKGVDLGYPKNFPIVKLKKNLHHGIVMSKYIICQSFKKFHRAVFSIAHPKYSNFGGILDARW